MTGDTKGFPAPISQKLERNRDLVPGEWTNRVPVDLLTRKGAYQGLGTGPALFLAALATLEPKTYFSKSRLCKAAGSDFNKARGFIPPLIEKGFIIEDGHSWTLFFPERGEADSKPKPKAKTEDKKKDREEEQAKQPANEVITPEVIAPSATPRAIASIVRHTQAPLAADTPDLASELATAWNESNRKGHLRTNVDGNGFPPHTLKFIKELSKEIDIPAEQIVSTVVRCAQPDGLYDPEYNEGTTPSYLFDARNSGRIRGDFRDILRKRRQETERQANEELRTFAKYSIEKIGDVADSFLTECIITNESTTGALQAFEKLKSRSGESRVLALKSKLYSSMDELQKEIIASDEYHRFLANKEKTVLRSTPRRNTETGGWILDDNGKVKYFEEEEIVSTKGDYFPLLNAYDKALGTEANFLNNILNACEHYGVKLEGTNSLTEG